MHPVAEDILTFWFGTVDLSAPIDARDVWFKATPEFDRALADAYAPIHARAAAGEFDAFADDAAACLALVLALDQFPRNIHRGTPRAFETDPKARDVARLALDRGYDRRFSAQPRKFLYLPFCHSEDLADQHRAVELYATLDDEKSLKSAVGHRDAIARFGRFPHRNAVLGRTSTDAERDYLKNPPTWGMTAAEAAELARRGQQA